MTATKLTELNGDALSEADELLGKASHDIAKYMAMTARNVEPSSIGPNDLSYLMDDLTQTNGTDPCWELWRSFSEALRRLGSDPALDDLDSRMKQLEELVAQWKANPESGVERIIVETLAFANGLASLRRELRKTRLEGER